MAEWDGNESSCSCDCGFDIPKGGTLESLNLSTPLGVESGGTGGNNAATVRQNFGIRCGKSSGKSGLTSSKAIDISIDFGVTFAAVPNVVVTPQTTSEAAAGYGIFFYIRSITTSGCTVRLTTNAPSDIGTVYVQWIAIGDE